MPASSYSRTHFHHMQRAAILAGDVDRVRELLEKGMDPNFVSGGDYARPVLVGAARNGRHDICRLLLDAGADVGHGNYAGVRAVDYAARADDVELFSMLVKAGAVTGPRLHDGVTSLHEAADSGALNTARMLLRAGAQVNAQDAHGRTALHRCASSGSIELTELLLASGADPNIETRVQETALHYALSVDSSAPFEKVVLLIAAGADLSYTPSQPSFDYLTPFQSVVMHWRENLVRQLFDLHPQDPAQQTAAGQTLLQRASNNTRMRILLNALATEFAVRGELISEVRSVQEPASRSSGFSPI
jgi:ankyrin repeat protein